MNSKYEIIEHVANLPYSCYLWESTKQPLNWHNDIELIMVLKGTLDIEVRGEKYHLRKEDVFLINTNQLHRLSSNTVENVNNSIILIFQFDPDYYQAYYPKFSDIIFHCNTALIQRTPKTYDTLRRLLVKLMWLSLNKTETFQLDGLQISLELIEFLITNFVKSISIQNTSQDQMQQRLIRIIEYINKNYNKKITLPQVANNEFMSAHYLSRFFKTHTGIGFNKYINQFRVNKSLNELLHTSKTILEIALDHGFSNSKSYAKHFKEHYGTSPSEFRKESHLFLKSTQDDSLKNSKKSEGTSKAKIL